MVTKKSLSVKGNINLYSCPKENVADGADSVFVRGHCYEKKKLKKYYNQKQNTCSSILK